MTTQAQAERFQRIWPKKEGEPLNIVTATTMAEAFLSSSTPDELKASLQAAKLHSDVMQILMIVSRELFLDDRNSQLFDEVTTKIAESLQQEIDLEVIKAYVSGEFGVQPLAWIVISTIQKVINDSVGLLAEKYIFTSTPDKKSVEKLQDIALPLLLITIKNYLTQEE